MLPRVDVVVMRLREAQKDGALDFGRRRLGDLPQQLSVVGLYCAL